MGGIAILALMFGYIWLSKCVIASLLKRSKAAAAISSIAFLILPFVDAAAGRLVLRSKCENDLRVAPSRVVKNVDGIFVDYVFKNSPEYYGYRFVEGENYGRLTRVTANGLQPAILEENVATAAMYELVDFPPNRSFWFNSYRHSIRERESGEVLATFVDHSFRGGWAERIAMTFSDAGPGSVAQCRDYMPMKETIRAILHATLEPSVP
jgi:hypothetical protein